MMVAVVVIMMMNIYTWMNTWKKSFWVALNFPRLETPIIAAGTGVPAAGRSIFPWKVRQMSQIIVGLPLDRTPGKCLTVLIIWVGAGHESPGGWNPSGSRWDLLRRESWRERGLLRWSWIWPPKAMLSACQRWPNDWVIDRLPAWLSTCWCQVRVRKQEEHAVPTVYLYVEMPWCCRQVLSWFTEHCGAELE